MNVNKWLKQNAKDLAGHTVAITGATGGLGGAICRHLLSLGANLILLDRNKQKSDALKAALSQEYPTSAIDQIPLDLSDMASVRAACAALSFFLKRALIIVQTLGPTKSGPVPSSVSLSPNIPFLPMNGLAVFAESKAEVITI